VIATKGGLTRTGPNQWPRDGRPEHCARPARLAAAARPRADRPLPAPRARPESPLRGVVGALKALQEEGKIRQIGVSNVSVEELATARGLVEVVSVQNRYNLGDREAAEVLEVCQRDGLAFIPGSRSAPANWPRRASGGGDRRAPRGQRGADRPGLAARPEQMLPIPGTRKVAHLEENVEAARIKLGDEEIAELDAAA